MAMPMMAGMAVHTIYVIVDTAFIGARGKAVRWPLHPEAYARLQVDKQLWWSDL